MAKKPDKIILGHGSGGKLSHELIRDFFVRGFGSTALFPLGDSAVLDLPKGRSALTTDTYTVSPLFFPGGDIGKLAVCGTVNDLAAVGAKPLYITAGFVLEAGLELSLLRRVVRSMAETAKEAGVQIVTGDTKVVEKGSCDKLYINTSGLGVVSKRADLGPGRVKKGDKILVNGPIGDHGAAVLSARQDLGFSNLRSDCAPLWRLVKTALKSGADIRFMRDATRGGLATVLNELAQGRGFGIDIQESAVPVREQVRAFSEVLGLEPYYMANEGRMVFVVAAKDEGKALKALHSHPLGRKAAVIGEAVGEPKGKVFLTTAIAGKRVLDMLVGDQFPRIC